MKQLDFIGENAAAIVLSDTITFGPSAIYVGGAGTVNVITANGQAATFTAVAGGRLPVLCIQVKTGGTASLMVRYW